MEKQSSVGWIAGIVVVAVLAFLFARTTIDPEIRTVEKEVIKTITVQDTAASSQVADLQSQLDKEKQAREDAENDLAEVRELPFNKWGFNGAQNQNQVVSLALSEIEDEFDNIDVCLNVTYREREMEIEDFDDVDVNYDFRDPSEYNVVFNDLEIEYDNDCTGVYDVDVEFDNNDIDVTFTLIREF